ncbi:glycoside hydrolase family 130 protein [Spirochaetota bacterium]
MPITIKRKDISFNPDPTRIISRFNLPQGDERIWSIFDRILGLSHEEVNITLNNVLRNFSKRHRNISKIFENNFTRVRQIVDDMDFESMVPTLKKKIQKLKILLQNLASDPKSESKKIKLLIGAFFTMEYSIESAAFFNPSIVEHPDQTDLREKNQKRVIISFRATGEGHISSIVFREGIIDKDNNIDFKSISKLVDVPEAVNPHVYDKNAFFQKLQEMNIYQYINGNEKEPAQKIIDKIIKLIMDKLEDKFIYEKLSACIEEAMRNPDLTGYEKKVMEAINWLADSHYEIEFSLDTAISERVIFPISYTERNGIEDARFVRFTDDDGSVTYCATYTAYDGYTILPKFLQTKDFYHFKVKPLNGIYAKNKGMALFPRKINGKFVMLSRYDGVNNYIMYSDNINLWQHCQKIESPMHPWEYIQTGNCGSPIETDKGWLVLTHGVGPMRKYCIGAVLLDLEDPTKVLGYLKEPLLAPNEDEREGYVPNVVYSCGSIMHNNELIIPYGISDTASTFATIPMDELLDELLKATQKNR